MDSKVLDIIQNMLKVININIINREDLIGIEILRSELLSEEVSNHFNTFKEKLKEIGYKTGNLTSLHNNNNSKQSWPSINILRQLLKCNNLHLKPLIKSNGYDKENGKKKVIRYFIIKEITHKAH